MNRDFGLRQILVLLLLLTVILSPRPIAGLLEADSARRLEAAGDPAGAESAYVDAAQRLPWQPSLWERAGFSALAAGQPQAAIQHFQQAQAAGHFSQAGWVGLGDASLLTGDGLSAIQDWKHALQDFEPAAEVCIRLGRQYRSLGNFEAALGYFQQAVSLAPADAGAHYQLGLLLAASQPAKALPDLVQAGQLDPSLAPGVQSLRTAINTALLSDQPGRAFLGTGQALAALGEWDLAGEAFRNAAAADSRDAEAWAWLAEARQQGGQDGSSEIRQALSLNPDSALVQGLYGLYLQRQGRLEEARTAFLRAVARQPEDAGWQLALGSLSEQTGDLIAARAYLMRAVELAPDSLPAWRAITAFSLRNGLELTTTGLLAARRLIQLAPDDWQSFDLAGQVLLDTGDTAGAEVLLKKALALDPTQAAPALHLALLYLQTGNQAGAFSYLNQAKAFDSAGPYGAQAARLLERYFP